MNPRRRVYRRRRRNPIRRRRASRRYRRNPVEISIRRPQTLLIPIAVGIGAKIAMSKLPSMIGTVPGSMTDWAVKIGIAIAPQFMKKLFGSANANVWTLVATADLAYGLAQQYVLSPMGFSGRRMGAFLPSYGVRHLGYSGPYGNQGYAAFPNLEMSARPQF